MNHDATHCEDYDKNKCPALCYRAQLTKDLEKRDDLMGFPISWAHFKGTKQCLLWPGKGR
jgi:hypothetical protein